MEEEELSPAELMGLWGGWEEGAAEEDEEGRGPFLLSDACTCNSEKCHLVCGVWSMYIAKKTDTGFL